MTAVRSDGVRGKRPLKSSRACSSCSSTRAASSASPSSKRARNEGEDRSTQVIGRAAYLRPRWLRLVNDEPPPARAHVTGWLRCPPGWRSQARHLWPDWLRLVNNEPSPASAHVTG